VACSLGTRQIQKSIKYRREKRKGEVKEETDKRRKDTSRERNQQRRKIKKK
jgi:hypothetical protein